MVYEVYVSGVTAIGRERWLVKAESLLVAVTKAQAKIRKAPVRWQGYEITSASKIGSLDIG